MGTLINPLGQAAVMRTRTISRQHRVRGKLRIDQRTTILECSFTPSLRTLRRQRAFRDRKERHVKDLELKLKSTEARTSSLVSDNERLKRQLDQLATQNEILRATSTPVKLPHQDAAQNQRANSASSSPKAVAAGTITNSSAAFNGAFSRPDAPISHRIQFSAQTGERLLATGAAWDLIQSHELYKKGLVDIGEVLDRLKEKVMCDGSGPSFAESDIINAVEQSVGIVGDELI